MLTFSSLSKRGQSSRYRLSGFLCPAKRWSAEKSNKATRICFAAAAICYSFALGRSSENLPRSSVIGRMVVIDLGVNVCASLSPSSHHLTIVSPFTLSLPPEFFPSPANPAANRGFPGLAPGISAAPPVRNPRMPAAAEGCRQPYTGATRPTTQPLALFWAFWKISRLPGSTSHCQIMSYNCNPENNEIQPLGLGATARDPSSNAFINTEEK